ncbi:sigma-70 family RNA polymerase sigma factor [Streptomyces sp. H27-D2]|uniref:sigma-70 family RNA polymerase sigma factor n=1 Tax=Streptomyces sp. H27-D2 TaxID=3046304 RepID=UPI002DC032D1|nr:sigma-70 family RNA polymerase sigma factor [Streptomyces sp. H27-D2]MEC4018112.1 sigma-70 family RNA polymerase sigma factor [Streptomyces sp. H27-D2]
MSGDGRDEPRESGEIRSGEWRDPSGLPARNAPGQSPEQVPEQGGPFAAGSGASRHPETFSSTASPSASPSSGSGDASGTGAGSAAAPGGASRAPGETAERARSRPGGSARAGAGAEQNVPQQREVDEGNTAPEVPPSDTELVARMRGGGSSAYEELYRRHADAVRRYARSCCRDAHTAEDLTGEVFARTLQAVRGGAGPDSAVRAYLLTTVRRVAAAWAKTATREQLVEDFAVFASTSARQPTDDDTLDLGADVRAMQEAEQSMAVQAFRSLPERWQTVLWHTTVEDESPSEVAPLLGLTANATAVLAHRAREGLKQAYLQAHVSTSLTAGGDCARYADRLGAYARGGLRMRAERGLRKHLEDCAKCRSAAMEVADVNERLRELLPLAVIGWFAAGYTLKAAGIVAGVAGAGAAGSAAAATGAAGAGAGAGAGGAAVSEGLGAPAKAGIAAGVVVAAGAAIALALAGSDAEPPEKPQAKPSAAPVVPNPEPEPDKPTPSASAKPKPKPPPPSAAAKPVPIPKPKPKPSPTPRKPIPKPPPPKPAPKPPPPEPPPPPKPQPPAPAPAPVVFPVNELRYDLLGDGSKPEVRSGGSSWLWQRWNTRIGGKSYGNGVTVRAPSSVLIDLNRSCASYDAFVGVDDMTLGLGAARFSVYGDGARLWQSGVVRAGSPAVPVHVPLAGRKTLRLVVEPRTQFDSVALADWAQSRISCQ